MATSTTANTLRLSRLQADAAKYNLLVVQHAYPPGGYSVEFPSLTTTFRGINDQPLQRSPGIWCRNLHEVASVIEHRPRFSKRTT